MIKLVQFNSVINYVMPDFLEFCYSKTQPFDSHEFYHTQVDFRGDSKRYFMFLIDNIMRDKFSSFVDDFIFIKSCLAFQNWRNKELKFEKTLMNAYKIDLPGIVYSQHDFNKLLEQIWLKLSKKYKKKTMFHVNCDTVDILFYLEQNIGSTFLRKYFKNDSGLELINDENVIYLTSNQQSLPKFVRQKLSLQLREHKLLNGEGK